MLKNPRLRRSLALLLIVLGGLCMFLAAEVWVGVLLLALGVGLELIGIRLEHQDTRLPKQCKYPPAEPGALVCEPLKAAMRGR